jgi:hypothetical protein
MDDLLNEEGKELVNSPSHHNTMSIETIEMARRIWGVNKVIAFLEISAFKYKMRAGEKTGEPIERELGKAKKCLKMAKEYKAMPDELTDEQKEEKLKEYALNLGFNVNIDKVYKQEIDRGRCEELRFFLESHYNEVYTLAGTLALWNFFPKELKESVINYGLGEINTQRKLESYLEL